MGWGTKTNTQLWSVSPLHIVHTANAKFTADLGPKLQWPYITSWKRDRFHVKLSLFHFYKWGPWCECKVFILSRSYPSSLQLGNKKIIAWHRQTPSETFHSIKNITGWVCIGAFTNQRDSFCVVGFGWNVPSSRHRTEDMEGAFSQWDFTEKKKEILQRHEWLTWWCEFSRLNSFPGPFFPAAKSKLCSLFTTIGVVHRTEDKILISDKLNRT